MNLKTIREKLADFSSYLDSPEGSDALFLYELPQPFQQHWNLEASDKKAMYLSCFQNSHTRRFWKREAFRPLEAMTLFWELDADYTANMFRDLFREALPVDGRIGRFVFHCDQMLAIYRKANPSSIFNSHYHEQDYWMVSLYLTMQFPGEYALYPDKAFRKNLEFFQAKPMPTSMPDLERYFKVARTLYKLMENEADLIEKHQNRLQPNRHYTDRCLLLVYEFLCFTADERLVP